MPDPYENKELRSVCGGTLRPGGLAITSEALALCAFPHGARLIDLGCGPGETLKYLREQGFEALGVDRSPDLLAEASAFGPVREADFHQLPFEDGSADGLLCECSLSLARDKSRVLAECFRVLKADGRLIVSDIVRMKKSGAIGPRSAGQTGGCLGGAADLETMRYLFQDNGFEVEHFVDHSRALRELAAKLVWHFGSAAALKELFGGGESCDGRDFGYALFIARRKLGDERNDND